VTDYPFSTSKHVRVDAPGEKRETTSLELFMDLVFVFAVTQLSHLLLNHLTWEGAAQTLFLLLATWWAWNYTTWMTNWLNPDSIPVRMMLIGVMLASLLMSIGIPDAFGDRAGIFVVGYLSVQIGRTAWALWALGPRTTEGENFLHILSWFLFSGVFWVLGALEGGHAQTFLWLAAFAIDFAGPAARYWVPGRGRSPSGSWTIDAAYFGERFQLFVIIALGESIVLTGATASELQIDFQTGLALAIAFLTTGALWWLYFDFVAKIAVVRLRLSDDPGSLGRDAYTYLHIPIVAGIIVAAVGDELFIAHPGEHLHAAEALVVVAGPAIYLVGHVLFRLRLTGTISERRLVGAGACLLLFFLHDAVSALLLATLVLLVLIVVIALDNRPGTRSRSRASLHRLEAELEARLTRDR
jgi:low temperature requirement protein LtrA